MCASHRKECIHWLLSVASSQFCSTLLDPLSIQDCCFSLSLRNPEKHPYVSVPQVVCPRSDSHSNFRSYKERGKEEPTKSLRDQELIMRNQTFMCINHPSVMLIYHPTAEHSGFLWAVGLHSPPSFQWPSPSPASPFFTFCWKFEKSHFIMKSNLMFACLSSQPSQVCLSPIFLKKMPHLSILPSKKMSTWGNFFYSSKLQMQIHYLYSLFKTWV